MMRAVPVSRPYPFFVRASRDPTPQSFGDVKDRVLSTVKKDSLENSASLADLVDNDEDLFTSQNSSDFSDDEERTNDDALFEALSLAVSQHLPYLTINNQRICGFCFFSFHFSSLIVENALKPFRREHPAFIYKGYNQSQSATAQKLFLFFFVGKIGKSRYG